MTLKRVLISLGVVVVMLVIIVGFIFEGAATASGKGHPVVVLIKPGTSVSGISDELSRDKVVDTPWFFDLYVRFKGSPVIQAGAYYMTTESTYAEALSILARGPKSVDVTVVPGMRLSGVGAALAKLPDGQTFARKFLVLARDPSASDFPVNAPKGATLEGFLYPDTYVVDPLAPPRQLVTEMVDEGTQQFESLGLGKGVRFQGLTSYQVLIGASLIEHEAKVAADYPKVARVIYNRLAAGMPLQFDSTVRFATGNETSPLTTAQLSSSSPYNTFTHHGLPPGPIGSVGSTAIEAMEHPAAGGWLYFVALKGHTRESFFDTFAAQQSAIAAYGEA